MTLEWKAQNWDEIVRVVRGVDALRRPGRDMDEGDILDVAVRALRKFPQQAQELAQARADLEAARRELRGGLVVLDPAKLVPLRHLLPTVLHGYMVAPRVQATPGTPIPGCRALLYSPPGPDRPALDFPVAFKLEDRVAQVTLAEAARQIVGVLHLDRGQIHEALLDCFPSMPPATADELADYLRFNQEDLTPWIKYKHY